MSAANDADVPQRRVIRVTVPNIDGTKLESTVSAERAKFADALGPSAIPSRNISGHFLNAVLIDIECRLELAEERSMPRTEIPKRLARFQRFAPLILRPYNYLTKAQREAAFEQTQALRGILTVLRAMASEFSSE